MDKQFEKTLLGCSSTGPSRNRPEVYTIAILLSLVLFATASASGAQSTISTAEIITLSRQATVKVVFQGAQPVGTGFFISPTHVATCFHVVASSWSARVEGGNAKDIKWEPRSHLQVVTSTGQVLDAQVISLPTPDDVASMQYDFAVLRVLTAPSPALTPLTESRQRRTEPPYRR